MFDGVVVSRGRTYTQPDSCPAAYPGPRPDCGTHLLRRPTTSIDGLDPLLLPPGGGRGDSREFFSGSGLVAFTSLLPPEGGRGDSREFFREWSRPVDGLDLTSLTGEMLAFFLRVVFRCQRHRVADGARDRGTVVSCPRPAGHTGETLENFFSEGFPGLRARKP